MMKGKLFNWIGGKKWLSKDLNNVFEHYVGNDIKYYLEPFAGGLGSFLSTIDTLNKINIEKIFLNDLNNTIIYVYLHLKNDFEELFNLYYAIEEEYNKTIPAEAFKLHKTKDKIKLKLLLEDSKIFFNLKKQEFNSIKNNNSVQSTALFLFLASHSFNGVYRENSKGEYNTPYNWETGVVSKDKKYEIFKEYSNLFNELNIEFSNLDCFSFFELHKDKIENSLIYCDPPYLNEEIGENKYNKDHFGKNEQKKLLEYYKNYSYVVFSNHLYPIFTDFCANNNFKYKVCLRSNIMSAKKETRGTKVPEILAYKY